jgi:transcriptional regulator with XRE-family HTH domain
MMPKKEETDKRLILIAEKIKQLRKSSNYTSYEDFALENDLDRKQYWRVENGSNITIKTLVKILDIHKISLKTFFNSIEL